MRKRKLEEWMAKAMMVFSTAVVGICLFLIIGTVVVKGLPYLDWDMVTKIPDGGYYFGRSGGMLNAIIGSFYVAGGATLLGMFISIPVAIYLNVYLKKTNTFARFAKLAFDVLFGVPSIVYGAFAFSLMVYLGVRASLLGGIIAVTLLVIPIMVRTLDEVITNVPKDLKEATLALGATRWEMAKVYVLQIKTGILTAVLLAFGRGVGDVAAVMFTAGFSDNIPVSLHEPAATLPLAIFFQLSSPIPEVQGRAYASALILTVFILIIVVLSTVLTNRKKK